jgi:hypothetical protein
MNALNTRASHYKFGSLGPSFGTFIALGTCMSLILTLSVVDVH